MWRRWYRGRLGSLGKDVRGGDSSSRSPQVARGHFVDGFGVVDRSQIGSADQHRLEQFRAREVDLAGL